MFAIRLPSSDETDVFRDGARRALAANIPPREIAFVTHDSGFLFDDFPKSDAAAALVTVPREFAGLMDDVLCHRADDRFALLYDVLWRLKHGEPYLLTNAADPAIAKLALYRKAIRRDVHKMHAFVRFHEKGGENGPLFLAWFEPDHFILKKATPFFADRFANMHWIIATPIGTASWDTKSLRFGPAMPKPEHLEDEVLSGLWRTYYRTIFNPARLKTDAMRKEMPRRYWKNMPEAELIPAMIQTASQRVIGMDREPDPAPRFAEKARPRQQTKTTADTMPKDSLEQLKANAAKCTACPLYKHATQTVFGEGPSTAKIVFVGEQPGDQEDITGKPFVGPAGQILNRALEEAGIDRARTYVTNAVKHFKFEPRGKRRIHSKPNTGEIQVCSHKWLVRELDLLEPETVVAMGATAAQALAGKAMAIGKNRGHILQWPDGRRGLITVHPSYLLRIPNAADKKAEYKKFVHDLKLIA
jgi:DNA polymerase